MTKTIHMKLHEDPFSKIIKGLKTIEIRLLDSKRKTIQINDEIIFTLQNDSNQKINTKVIGLFSAKTFEDLFQLFPLKEFGYTDKMDAENIYSYYSKADEERYGVLGIQIQCIKCKN